MDGYPAVKSFLKGGHAWLACPLTQSNIEYSLLYFNLLPGGFRWFYFFFSLSSSWHHFLKRLHMGAHPCDGLAGRDCQIAFVWCLIYWIKFRSQASNIILKDRKNATPNSKSLTNASYIQLKAKEQACKLLTSQHPTECTHSWNP